MNLTISPADYWILVLVALGAAAAVCGCWAIEERNEERVKAYFDRQFGPKRTKTSVPGPRGNAGDPARHGGFLPCPVPVPPDAGDLSQARPHRAGGFYVNTEVHRLAAVAQSVADQIEEQRRASRTVIPFWQAARVSRITAELDMRRDDESRWPHLMRAWTAATDTGSFPAICLEVA